MDKKLVIKLFKIRKKSKNNFSKIIVVGYNTSKVNGGYIEKIGSIGSLSSNSNRDIEIQTKVICSINFRRLGFWLNKGAKINNTRIS
jgi:ribosomal protein S16